MRFLVSLLVAAAATLAATPAAAQCGTGSTLTHYLSGNGNYAVMFDITPTVDMTIECIDVNAWNTGSTFNVTFHYSVGTCVGIETNPAAWTQFASVVGVAGQAPGTPTILDISGNGQVFLAGQTYGIYLQSPGSILAYTNGGPTGYTGDHCDLMTYYGASLNWAGVNIYREFNGELHTDTTGPPAPALALTCGGGTATAAATNMTPGGPVAFVYGPAIPYVHGGNPCNGLALDLTPLSAPLIISADATGAASLTRPVGPAACGSGVLVQVVDVATCVATNSAAL